MLARAWKEQEELKRKIKGKGDPKQVDVEAQAEHKRRHRPVEPSSFDPSARPK